MNANPRFPPARRAASLLTLTAFYGLVLGQASAQESAKTPAAGPSKTREFQIFRLKSANAVEVARQFQELFGATARFVADPNTNTVLISATDAEGLARIGEVLKLFDNKLDLPAADSTVQLFDLKYARAADMTRILKDILGIKQVSTVTLGIDERRNTVIATAPAPELAKIRDIIAKVDVAGEAKERHGPSLNVFQLKSIEPDKSLDEALRLALRAGDGNFAVDRQRRLVILSADMNTTKTVEALLTRLEAGGPGQTDQDMQVRIVWLVNGLAREDAPAPPEDLKEVLPTLAKLGIDRPRLAGQTLVNVTPTTREFQARGTARLDVPCPFSVTGRLIDRKQTPVLEVSIRANRLDSKEEICSLQTEISAPPGHLVVLGMTPTYSATSVFLVQVLRRDVTK